MSQSTTVAIRSETNIEDSPTTYDLKSPPLEVDTKFLPKTDTVDNETSSKPAWTFRKYCEKYDSIRAIEKAKDKLRRGLIKEEDVFDDIVDTMDPTEDLMALKIAPTRVDQLNPRRSMSQSESQLSANETEFYPNDTRRYPAFGPEMNKNFILPYDNTKAKGGFDPFYIRARLLELMKQTIYNVRIKMIPMQQIRYQFKSNSLYKMGWLISKTDNKCKVYSKVAWLAWRACMNFRQNVGAGKKHTILDMLPTEERLLYLRLEIDLLTDLVMENAHQAQRVLARFAENRVQHFKFQD